MNLVQKGRWQRHGQNVRKYCDQLFFRSKGEEKEEILLTAKIKVGEAFQQGGETLEVTI